MSVSMDKIPANIRVPLFYAEVDGSANVFQQIQQPALLVGQKLAAGTAVAGVPVLVSRTDEARQLFGQGSMLARMHAAYRAGDAFGEVWCLPLADNGAGTAATFTVTVTGPATESGVLPLYVAGQRLEIGVASGDIDDDVAAAIAAAVNAAPELPVTAAAVDEVVTLTARHKGTLGNDIDIRAAYLGQLGAERVPAGIALVIAAGVAGAGDPDLAAALAALGDEVYDFVVQPWNDTASLNAFRDAWNDDTGRWAWSRQVYGHVFGAKRATLANLATFGAARNDPHMTVIGYWDSPTPPWEWAAALAAASAKSLVIDPARPTQTLPLAGVRAPLAGSTGRFTLSERQTLLFKGLATWFAQSDGTVAIERSITTYQKNAWNQADPSFLDIETLFTLVYVLRRLRLVVTQKFGRHKLANDGTAFGEGQAIVTPKIIKAELVAQYAEMEALGLVENRAAFIANTIVERDATDPNRVNVLYAPDLVNQLRIFALKAQFRLQYPADAA